MATAQRSVSSMDSAMAPWMDQSSGCSSASRSALALEWVDTLVRELAIQLGAWLGAPRAATWAALSVRMWARWRARGWEAPLVSVDEKADATEHVMADAMGPRKAGALAAPSAPARGSHSGSLQRPTGSRRHRPSKGTHWLHRRRRRHIRPEVAVRVQVRKAEYKSSKIRINMTTR